MLRFLICPTNKWEPIRLIREKEPIYAVPESSCISNLHIEKGKAIPQLFQLEQDSYYQLAHIVQNCIYALV